MATAPAAPKPAQAATEARPLTDEERATMRALMAREMASMSVHSPAVQVGEEYVALTNISVPRRGDKDKMSDLVMKGDTVWLTEEEARPLLRHDPHRDGRHVPVIRKKHGPESSAELPFLLPKTLSGFRTGPPEGARTDPAGSSFIMQGPPEANPPVPGSEATAGQETRGTQPQQDAMDLPPTRSAAQQAREQVADPEIIDNVKAAMPPGVRDRMPGSSRR